MVVLFAIVMAVPLVLVEYLDWRYPAAFWAFLFLGSGLLKLLGLGF